MTTRRQEHAITTGAPLLDIAGMPTPPPWTEDAICPQVDLDIFFPEKGGSTAAVKAVCAGCPVRRPCLEYALANEDSTSTSERILAFGIWGGLSPRERRKLIRARHRAALQDGAA